MNKKKLLLITFVIAFISTASLCMVSSQPLIFYPINYELSGFINFAVLIFFLNVGLVYINLPLLKWLKKFLKLNIPSPFFYVLFSVLFLQIVTLITGYLESSANRIIEADMLYYYKCVSNSCIYILTGNLTTIIAGYLFGKEETNNIEVGI